MFYHIIFTHKIDITIVYLPIVPDVHKPSKWHSRQLPRWERAIKIAFRRFEFKPNGRLEETVYKDHQNGQALDSLSFCFSPLCILLSITMHRRKVIHTVPQLQAKWQSCLKGRMCHRLLSVWLLINLKQQWSLNPAMLGCLSHVAWNTVCTVGNSVTLLVFNNISM